MSEKIKNIIIIVCLILIFLMSGYLIYDRLIKNNDQNDNIFEPTSIIDPTSIVETSDRTSDIEPPDETIAIEPNNEDIDSTKKYQAYKIGDKIVFNNENWYVISDSSEM